jgi:hypothetical protein
MADKIVHWIKQSSAFNSEGNDITTLSYSVDANIAYKSCTPISTDTNGDVYFAYIVGDKLSGTTTNDICIGKMDISGNLQWVVQPVQLNSGTGTLLPKQPSIAVGTNGIFVCYSTTGAVTGGTNTTTSNNDVVIAKLNKSDGAVVWTKQDNVNVNVGGSDFAGSIVVDANDNVYVSFVSGGSPEKVTVVKYSTEGIFTWKKTDISISEAPTAFTAAGFSILAIDNTNNVLYLTYSVLISAQVAAIAKLDASTGNQLWARSQSTLHVVPTGVEMVSSIAVDKNGDVLGSYYTRALLSGITTTDYSIVVFKVDKATGDVIWIKQPTEFASSFPTTDDSRASIVVDSANNIYVSFQAEGGVNGNTVVNLGPNMSCDVIIAKMDNVTGNVLSVSQSSSLNTLGNNRTSNIAISTTDELYVIYTTNGIVYDSSGYTGTPIIESSTGIPTVAKYNMTTDTVEWRHQDIYTNSITGLDTDGQLVPGILKSVRDSFGNLYVLATAAQGGQLNTAETMTSDNLAISRPYLFKLDSSGKLLWILFETLPNGAALLVSKTQTTCDIVLDNDNNCIFCVRVAALGAVQGGTAVGATDIYIVKVNSNGEIIWTKQDNTFLTISIDSEVNASLCVDLDNNIYLGTETRGTIYGDVSNTYNYSPMLAKFDRNSNTLWAKIVPQITTGTTGAIQLTKLATNSTYIAMAFCLSTTVITGDPSATASGSQDIVVCLFDMSGNRVWARQRPTFNTTAADLYPDISIDANSNVYVVYNTTGTISGGTKMGTSDIVVIKFDNVGTLVWSKQTNAINSSGADDLPRMYNDLSNQRLYIVYRAAGAITGGSLVGTTDIVLVTLDYNGNILSTKQNVMGINTTSTESRPSIIVDGDNAYITYSTPYISTPEASELRRSMTDIVVAKLGSATTDTTASLIIPFVSHLSGRVSSITKTSVSLSWVAPEGVVAGYRIYRQNADGTDTQLLQLDAVPSATVTGLTENTRYQLKVAAYNTAGEGKRTRFPPFVTIPNAPTNIIVTTGSPNTTVSWTVAASEGTVPQYAIYDISNGIETVIKYVSGSVTTTTIPTASITDKIGVKSLGNGVGKSVTLTNAAQPTSDSSAADISTYAIANLQSNTSAVVSILDSITDSTKLTTVMTSILGNRGAASSLSYMGPILSATSSYSLRERIGKAAMANLLTVANTSEGRFTAMKDALISLQGETSDTDVLTGIMTALSDYTNEVLPTIIALLTAARSAPSKKPIYFQKVREIATGRVSVPNDTLLSAFRATFTQGTDASSAFMTAASFDVLVPTSTTIAIDTTIVNVPTYLPILPDTQYTLTVGAASVPLSIASANGVLSINGTSVSLGQSVTIGTRVFRVDAIGTVAFTYTGPYVPPTPPTPPTDEGTVICFLGSAPVMTPTGYRKIYRMQAGDAVISADTGKTIVVTQVVARVHTASASTTPYVIEKGVFGATHTLYVSPNHKIYVAGRGMVEARDLGLPRASLTGEFTYYNIEVEGGDNITVGGVKVESLADVRRATISYNQFADMLCKKYGTGALTPATIANIKRTCVAVGPNHVSVPMMRRQSSAQSSRV